MGILQFNNSDKKHAFSTEHDVSITMFVSIAFSVLAAAFIAAFAVFLIAGGAPALKREGADFVAHADWHYRVLRFGAGSMVYGSAVVAIIAILFSVPLGIGSAVLTSEYLQRPLRTILKMTVEFLAGIPSVVYGLLGVL
ncbi:MAG: hypothetical protein KC649_01925, partial [Candidatus Omnitrophica bacterium]|nr:hypothetical protein [Candidatus Omnitrophota bacterium]